MDARAADGLISALWKIHNMFSELNCGKNIDAKDVDELEKEILAVEDYLEHDWDHVPDSEE